MAEAQTEPGKEDIVEISCMLGKYSDSHKTFNEKCAMPKLKYCYHPWWDIVWAFRTLKNRRWLESKKLVVFQPSAVEMIKLWFKKPVCPAIETEYSITCYWISSGTWGSYSPPNKVFICPRGLVNMERVIRHEIAHLKYASDTEKMTHEEKEKYINNKQILDKS